MEELKNLKQEVEDKWILEWTFHNPCNWIRRLIRNPLILIRKKWKINHYVMQVLTGHGIFNHYRHRVGKKRYTSCWDCGDDLDDAEHVLFKCSRWVVERTALESEVGVEFKLDNIFVRMAAEDRLWRSFTIFNIRMMKLRQLKERNMEVLSSRIRRGRTT
ncbi:uncharacterized protein LOC105666904 [Bombus terrestris]|uniref:Uncharacterized protein LOC105666904 n=1 Tax=Bombus terrestris TaxID=30195 RepID=A0A9B2MUF5_BOMTE|nr:uncharacterized protein LOC105666904 [Bombus terrestris]